MASHWLTNNDINGANPESAPDEALAFAYQLDDSVKRNLRGRSEGSPRRSPSLQCSRMAAMSHLKSRTSDLSRRDAIRGILSRHSESNLPAFSLQRVLLQIPPEKLIRRQKGNGRIDCQPTAVAEGFSLDAEGRRGRRLFFTGTIWWKSVFFTRLFLWWLADPDLHRHVSAEGVSQWISVLLPALTKKEKLKEKAHGNLP